MPIWKQEATRRPLWLAGLALCLLAPLTSLAADKERNLTVAKVKPAAERRVALVIGNSRYKSAPLANPVNDARAVAAKLKRLGFEVVLRENLTHRQIGSVLREFRSRLQPGGVALFFYAGHGLQVNGVNYLPVVDADIAGEEDVPTQALDVNLVLELMDEAKTRMNLVFLDACRNNPYARSFRSAADGLAKVNAPSGTILSFATRPGSVAADAGSGRNGLYTEHLLAAMDLADQPIEQALKRVVSGVKRASRGRQEPWMEGSIEGDFYFRRTGQGAQTVKPAISTDPIAVELVYWESIQDSTRVEDYESYLRKYPDGQFAGLARSRIKTASTAENSAVPDIAGSWHWSVRSIFVADRINNIRTDGTCTLSDGTNCKWIVLQGTRDRISFHFDDRWTHEMTLSEDGMRMSGTDDWGTAVTGSRAVRPE